MFLSEIKDRITKDLKWEEKFKWNDNYNNPNVINIISLPSYSFSDIKKINIKNNNIVNNEDNSYESCIFDYEIKKAYIFYVSFIYLFINIGNFSYVYY